jgi:hypothetical protein
LTLALVNPHREEKHMARSQNPTYEELREELEATQMALEEANDKLNQIFDLAAEEPEPEDFEEDDFDFEDEEPEER